MLARDTHGIIVQHPSMDGGDSAARTGIAALKLEADVLNLERFMTKSGLLIRHPKQADWNDPKKTSRDQLVQFCVSDNKVTALVANKYKDRWFINKDFLDPSVKLYLYACAKVAPPFWLNTIGCMWLFLSFIWNTEIKRWDEKNQFACMCIRFGPQWCHMLIRQHPNISKAIMDYWSGWRDQKELGYILLETLKAQAVKWTSS